MFLLKRTNVSDVFFSSAGFNRERPIKFICIKPIFYLRTAYNVKLICTSFSNKYCIESKIRTLNFSIWFYN